MAHIVIDPVVDHRAMPDSTLRLSLRQLLLPLCAAGLLLPAVLAAQVLPLPDRPADALSGRQIMQALWSLSRSSREDRVFTEVMRGNVPSFMRQLVPVTSSASVGGVVKSVTYYVTPEYLSLGSDDDYFLMPMSAPLAQRIADALQCTLPTRKMVNAIYAASGLKLEPKTISPTAAMITVPVFATHDSLVHAQRDPVRTTYPLGTLVGGTHKDVVISNLIRTSLKTYVPKPVVIYGWHKLDGTFWQPLYNGHEETYADYSHGIRLVQEAVSVGGSATTVSSILKDATLYVLLSDEGVIPNPRYGDAPADVEESAEGSPGEYGLDQNYPNPFNPRTRIRFDLPAAAEVRLVVFDLLGREVVTLADGEMDAGGHVVTFDGEGLASGAYFCRLTYVCRAVAHSSPVVQTRKMVLAR